MTVPAAGSATSRFDTPTFSPAAASVAVASACVSPVTSGTLTSFGPEDTNTVTGLPTWTSIPAAGLVEMTRPFSTDSLVWFWLVG